MPDNAEFWRCRVFAAGRRDKIEAKSPTKFQRARDRIKASTAFWHRKRFLPPHASRQRVRRLKSGINQQGVEGGGKRSGLDRINHHMAGENAQRQQRIGGKRLYDVVIRRPQCVSGRAREDVLTYAPQALRYGRKLHSSAPARVKRTRAVSDFPTLALSRSGGTGISRPSQRRAPQSSSLPC